MGPVLIFQVLICAMGTFALKPYPDGVYAKCLERAMRFTLDSSLVSGNGFEVGVVDGNNVYKLDPAFEAQCGYTRVPDQWGNIYIYASTFPCGHKIQADGSVDVSLQLRTNIPDVSGAHVVSKSCRYSELASRNVLCAPNYMEVFVELDHPTTEELNVLLQGLQPITSPSKPMGKKSPRLQKVVFYTPEEQIFTPQELRMMGLGLYTTRDHLLLRSPFDTITAYSQNVAGIPMSIIKSSVLFRHRWVSSTVNIDVACPTGGVSFSNDRITWRLPRHISPMLDVSSQTTEIVELYISFPNKRYDQATLEANGYSLIMTDDHIVLEIPIGSPDGFYKSHIHRGRYHTSYSIVAVIEMTWQEALEDQTNYIVVFPINTPPVPQRLFVEDYTDPDQGLFMIVLGSFLLDVDLVSITTSNGVFTMPQAAENGLVIKEHLLNNGTKAFSLEVAFTHPAVSVEYPIANTKIRSMTVEFGFVVLPDMTSFSHRAVLRTTEDTATATVSGICDQENFYVTVAYGDQGLNFDTFLHDHPLTNEMAHQFNLKENQTSFTLTVPFGSREVAFESVQETAVRGRIDVTLQDRETGHKFRFFSLACFFITSIIECTTNGTVGALAVKLEGVPSLDPSHLTLNDPSCGPLYSDERYAFFYFGVSTCGTTREFDDGVMRYINRATLKDADGHEIESNTDSEYRFVFICEYAVNSSKTLAFHTTPQVKVPVPQSGLDDLHVSMRLARDARFTHFYTELDYPVLRYLRQPLFFELELRNAHNPNVQLIAKNCWATLNEDRTSKPQWDVVVNGCPNSVHPNQVVFHPVRPDHRVKMPSLFKRFEVKMLSYAEDESSPTGQMVFHCDVVLCDSSSPFDSLCHKTCAKQQMLDNLKTFHSLKRGRRAAANMKVGSTDSGIIFLV